MYWLSVRTIALWLTLAPPPFLRFWAIIFNDIPENHPVVPPEGVDVHWNKSIACGMIANRSRACLFQNELFFRTEMRTPDGIHPGSSVGLICKQHACRPLLGVQTHPVLRGLLGVNDTIKPRRSRCTDEGRWPLGIKSIQTDQTIKQRIADVPGGYMANDTFFKRSIFFIVFRF